MSLQDTGINGRMFSIPSSSLISVPSVSWSCFCCLIKDSVIFRTYLINSYHNLHRRLEHEWLNFHSVPVFNMLCLKLWFQGKISRMAPKNVEELPNCMLDSTPYLFAIRCSISKDKSVFIVCNFKIYGLRFLVGYQASACFSVCLPHITRNGPKWSGQVSSNGHQQGIFLHFRSAAASHLPNADTRLRNCIHHLITRITFVDPLKIKDRFSVVLSTYLSPIVFYTSRTKTWCRVGSMIRRFAVTTQSVYHTLVPNHRWVGDSNPLGLRSSTLTLTFLSHNRTSRPSDSRIITRSHSADRSFSGFLASTSVIPDGRTPQQLL